MVEFGPCRLCGLPVVEGEPRHALYEFEDPPRFTHYACWERRDAEYRASVARAHAATGRALDALGRLRRTLK